MSQGSCHQSNYHRFFQVATCKRPQIWSARRNTHQPQEAGVYLFIRNTTRTRWLINTWDPPCKYLTYFSPSFLINAPSTGSIAKDQKANLHWSLSWIVCNFRLFFSIWCRKNTHSEPWASHDNISIQLKHVKLCAIESWSQKPGLVLRKTTTLRT